MDFLTRGAGSGSSGDVLISVSVTILLSSLKVAGSKLASDEDDLLDTNSKELSKCVCVSKVLRMVLIFSEKYLLKLLARSSSLPLVEGRVLHLLLFHSLETVLKRVF